SAVRAIHSIAPWRSAATNSASRAAAGQGASTLAMPQASKPSCAAAPRIAASRDVSEVEVVIVAGRRQAGPAVGQQRPERRPGLDLHVPGLHRRDLAPRHVAEVV